MAKREYVVGPDSAGQWQMTVDRRTHGPYSTRDIVVKAAVDAAQNWGKAHADDTAQVLVQGLNGTFQTEWIYGKDAYPPKN